MTSKWKTRGEQMLATIPAEDKTRTCCNCCHIKTGTVCLGLIELVVVSLFLAGIAQQLKWKRSDASFCFKRMWRDCLLFNFHHFNLTLAGDYMMLLVMLLVIVSILLLFCGICSVSPRMLLPHLVIQAIALICSAGYFFLYAWSYFYGDLYTQNQPFQMQSFVERMWLATVVLILSAFQFYLFFTVIKCVLYLQKMRTERNRRKRQFMECSNRVRMAKENGMWRQTSWGGGFQQYKGQYDESKQQSAKKKDKPASHVKWDLRKNTEKSISCVRDIGNPGFEEAPESPKHKPSEEAPVKVVHKHTPRHHSPVSVKKSDSPHHSPKRKPTSSEPKSSVESSRDHRKLQRTDDKTIGGYVGKTAVSGPASPVRRTSVDSNGPLVKPKQNSAVASATKTKQLPRQTSTSSSGGSRKSPEKPSTHHHSSSHRHSEGNAGGGSSASKPAFERRWRQRHNDGQEDFYHLLSASSHSIPKRMKCT
ncbi:hypothetical protein L596_028176 [Steinernema carpocapsae]|uniref:Uncharacterized protein n=1 Tax=Steinernema carpocapsae TaxID=34508 RepID=A0A4U5LXM8_STECR|nr:hypothetical protein L596_028176 [Steinernema carpocapsae]